MKKSMIALFLLTLFTITACSSDDDNDSNLFNKDDNGNNDKNTYLDNKLIEGAWDNVSERELTNNNIIIDSIAYNFNSDQAYAISVSRSKDTTYNSFEILRTPVYTYQLTDSIIILTDSQDRIYTLAYKLSNNNTTLSINNDSIWIDYTKIKE